MLGRPQGLRVTAAQDNVDERVPADEADVTMRSWDRAARWGPNCP